ncbi:MarR family winged helix-turn-helix transcriptional regulator [Paenibacillus sp. YN15]|uniref:MarR family winged helix-turn-helix transcriptional regulator n=1 Tax=Paenibacillus sp. YN15 TaxID=1742774 RepID=UPI000DCE9C35|nr:MarR family transcriptional regulator [Paenibacillus sp. YN15]RAU92574.1 MarR family transcriptional regulator [Paenibacillus sp. YN15]
MNTNSTDLFELFTRLNWLLHRYHQRNHRHFGPMGDPHRGQGRILALLKLKPEISQKELSEILDMRSQSLGEMLGKLEKSGYITRAPSEADRRVMEIKLTEAGKAASFQKDQHLDKEALFTGLSEEEQEKLGEYLSRVISTLEQLLGNSGSESDFPERPSFDPHSFGPHGGKHGHHRHFGGEEFGDHPRRGRGGFPFDGRGMGWGRGKGMKWGPGRGEDPFSEAPQQPDSPPEPRNQPENPEQD